MLYTTGGVPDLSKLPVGSVSGLPIPFKGCIRQVSLNWHHTALDPDHIMAARNIADCDGTGCGGDVCEHGGSCWLDKHHLPHCTCLQVQHNAIQELYTAVMFQLMNNTILMFFTGVYRTQMRNTGVLCGTCMSEQWALREGNYIHCSMSLPSWMGRRFLWTRFVVVSWSPITECLYRI